MCPEEVPQSLKKFFDGQTTLTQPVVRESSKCMSQKSIPFHSPDRLMSLFKTANTDRFNINRATQIAELVPSQGSDCLECGTRMWSDVPLLKKQLLPCYDAGTIQG